MCLDTVNKEKKITDNEGYKLVDGVGPTYRLSPIMKRRGWVRMNKWIKDKARGGIIGHRHNDDKIINYDNGFHLFPTQNDALKFAEDFGWQSCNLVRVQFRGVVCTGTQSWNDSLNSDIRIIVAKEVKILKYMYGVKEELHRRAQRRNKKLKQSRMKFPVYCDYCGTILDIDNRASVKNHNQSCKQIIINTQEL